MKYLFLPKQVSDFEQNYLRQINFVALIIVACHLPLIAAVDA